MTTLIYCFLLVAFLATFCECYNNVCGSFEPMPPRKDHPCCIRVRFNFPRKGQETYSIPEECSNGTIAYHGHAPNSIILETKAVSQDGMGFVLCIVSVSYPREVLEQITELTGGRNKTLGLPPVDESVCTSAMDGEIASLKLTAPDVPYVIYVGYTVQPNPLE